MFLSELCLEHDNQWMFISFKSCFFSKFFYRDNDSDKFIRSKCVWRGTAFIQMIWKNRIISSHAHIYQTPAKKNYGDYFSLSSASIVLFHIIQIWKCKFYHADYFSHSKRLHLFVAYLNIHMILCWSHQAI